MPRNLGSRRRALVSVGFALALGSATGCSPPGPDGSLATVTTGPTAPADASAPVTAPVAQRFPDVLAVEIRRVSEDSYELSVTLSSPYDAPERYADGWRVLAPDGTPLGEHQLGHDHADEQPFTRTQRGLRIPSEVDDVTVEGRDQVNGFGGGTITVEVPRGPA